MRLRSSPRRYTAGLALFIGGLAAGSLAPDAEADIHAAFEILQRDCLKCHNAEKRKGGLVMSSRESLLEGGESGAAIVPGKASESFLVELLFPDADPHMPPKSQLEPTEIQTLERWIDGGAKWDAGLWEELRTRRRTETIELAELPPGFGSSLAVALSPDGRRLAAARGKQVGIHELGGTGPPLVLDGHSDLVQSLAWSADGKRLASGGFRKVLLWETANWGEPRERSAGLGGRITALEFAPDGETLIAADSIPSAASQLHWWSWEKDGLQTVDAAHDDTIFDIEVSPDGEWLASAGADKVVRLRKPVDGKLVKSLEGFTGYVTALAFAPGSDRLATGDDEGAIKVWRIESGKRVSRFGGDAKTTGPVSGLAWTEHTANAKKKAAEKDKEKAAAINTDLILATFRGGRPSSYSDLVEHEGEQRSTGARARALDDSGEHLSGLALDRQTGKFFAGSASGHVFAWDTAGKMEQLSGAGAEPAEPTVSFRNDVLPVLSKAGCSAGACHAKAGGQNGFEFSVFAYDPKSDHRELLREARGRRVFPASPEHSLFLLKATNTIPHEGEERIAKGSPEYQLLLRWIREGAAFEVPGEPSLEGIAVAPDDASYAKGEARQLAVTARYSDGSTREVTALSEFTSPEAAFAAVDEHGEVKAGNTAGDGTVIARYLDQVATARITIPPDQLQPEAAYAGLPVANEIDRLAQARFRKLGLLPSEPCSDAEFIRRATLDVLGALPDPERVRTFLADTDPAKRDKLVDELLGGSNSTAYADYWATKWGDLLRPNTQRVGVKPVYLLDGWIRERLRENVGYDRFVRELLTASGSTHESGPVALFRDKREPEDIAEFTSQIFLGTRINCARCHHHPSERWGQDDYYALAAFFSSMRRKGQGISAPISGLPEFWWFAPGGEVRHPVSGEVMVPRPPGGPAFAEIPADQDPREVLVDWMTAPDNALFAKAAVNRVWGELFGRGIVHPVDDFRASNPPANGPLLEWLAEDFVAGGYDLKKLLRRILRSGLYQQSTLPNATNAGDLRNFSRSYRRRLPAEVLADAVASLTRVPGSYQGMPDGAATAMRQWNHKLPSEFLDAFGRPNSSAAPPCERELTGSAVQALHLMHSKDLQRKLDSPKGWAAALAKSGRPHAELVDELYLATYSRFPDGEEREIALAYFENQPETACADLLWALINSAEFVFNH